MGRGGRTRSVVLLAAALGAAAVAGCSPPANELPVPEVPVDDPDRSAALRYAYEQQVVEEYADDVSYLEQAWARGTDG